MPSVLGDCTENAFAPPDGDWGEKAPEGCGEWDGRYTPDDWAGEKAPDGRGEWDGRRTPDSTLMRELGRDKIEGRFESAGRGEMEARTGSSESTVGNGRVGTKAEERPSNSVERDLARDAIGTAKEDCDVVIERPRYVRGRGIGSVSDSNDPFLERSGMLEILPRGSVCDVRSRGDLLGASKCPVVRDFLSNALNPMLVPDVAEMRWYVFDFRTSWPDIAPAGLRDSVSVAVGRIRVSLRTQECK